MTNNGPSPHIKALRDRVSTADYPGTRVVLVRQTGGGALSMPMPLLGRDSDTAVEAVLAEVAELEDELAALRAASLGDAKAVARKLREHT